MKKIMLRISILGSICAFGTSVAADPSTFLFKQDLEGVYSQSWYAHEIFSEFENSKEIAVIGVGKLGEFRGILYLACNEARYSRWISVGDTMGPDSVPPEAIAKIRDIYC